MKELIAWAEQMASWLEAQAARCEEQNRGPFLSLREAYAADAKNYAKMAKDARAALARARQEQP